MAIFNIPRKRKLYTDFVESNKDPNFKPQEDILQVEGESGLFSQLWKSGYNIFYVIRTFLPRYGEEDTLFMYNKYGRDAAIYILFQRYLLISLGICTLVSLVTLIPIHTTGSIPGIDRFNLTESHVLMRTSVSMILDAPWKLYFHVILAIFFSLVFIFWIHRFQKSVAVSDPKYGSENTDIRHQIAKYTVQMLKLDPEWTNNDFEKFCFKMFPDRVISCSILWDVSPRLDLDSKMIKIKNHLDHYSYLNDQYNKRVKSYSGMDYVDYYESKLTKLQKEAARWDTRYQNVLAGEDHNVNRIRNTRNGFITFKSMVDVQECLRIKEYSFRQANEPDDIEWYNMCTHKTSDVVREVFAHGIMIIILVFFTTPVAMTSSIESLVQLPVINDIIRDLRSLTGILGDLIFQYFPTLLVFLIGIFFSGIVLGITMIAKYKTVSKYDRMVLFRMYCYLTLSSFVMPAFLLSSVDGVIMYLREGNIYKMFELMYLPSSGAFFMNFLLQVTLLKNVTDLIRLYDVFFYILSMCRTLTPRERFEASDQPYFAFSLEYAYLLTITCMVLTISLFSPLILLFGMAFLLLKHFFDRYNIKIMYRSKVQTARTTSFSAHQKTIQLVLRICWANLLIFMGFVLIFFAIKITTNYIYISHLVVILMFFIFLVIGFIVLMGKSRFAEIWTRNRESLELVMKFKEADAKNAYLPPFEFVRRQDKFNFDVIETFVE